MANFISSGPRLRSFDETLISIFRYIIIRSSGVVLLSYG